MVEVVKPEDKCAFKGCPEPWLVEFKDRHYNLWRLCYKHARQMGYAVRSDNADPRGN